MPDPTQLNYVLVIFPQPLSTSEQEDFLRKLLLDGRDALVLGFLSTQCALCLGGTKLVRSLVSPATPVYDAHDTGKLKKIARRSIKANNHAITLGVVDFLAYLVGINMPLSDTDAKELRAAMRAEGCRFEASEAAIDVGKLLRNDHTVQA